MKAANVEVFDNLAIKKQLDLKMKGLTAVPKNIDSLKLIQNINFKGNSIK